MAFTFDNVSLKLILNTLCSTRYIKNYKDTFFEDIMSFDKYKDSTKSIVERDIEYQHIIIDNCRAILNILLRTSGEEDIQLDTKLLADPENTASIVTEKFKYFSSIHNNLTKSSTTTNVLSKLMNIIAHMKIYYSNDYNTSTLVAILSAISTKYGSVVYDERSFVNYTIHNLITTVDPNYDTKRYFNVISINNVSQECGIDLVKLGMNYFNNIQSIYNYLDITNYMFDTYSNYIKSTDFDINYYDGVHVTDTTNHTSIINLCLITVVLTIAIVAEYDQFKLYYTKARS